MLGDKCASELHLLAVYRCEMFSLLRYSKFPPWFAWRCILQPGRNLNFIVSGVCGRSQLQDLFLPGALPVNHPCGWGKKNSADLVPRPVLFFSYVRTLDECLLHQSCTQASDTEADPHMMLPLDHATSTGWSCHAERTLSFYPTCRFSSLPQSLESYHPPLF